LANVTDEPMGLSQAVSTSLIEGVPTFWIREVEPKEEPDAAGHAAVLEPAAATGFAGALHAIWQLPMGPLTARLARATHVIWTTGGSLLPDAEYADLLATVSQTQAVQETQ
jgi:D-serine dehydratase